MKQLLALVLTLLVGSLLSMCQSSVPSNQQSTTFKPTATIAPTPDSTLAWVAVDRTTQQIIYTCYEPAGMGGFTSLCAMNTDRSNPRYLAHHLISNVLRSSDGQRLYFGLWDTLANNAYGILYQLRLDTMEIQPLPNNKHRFFGYQLQQIVGDWLYFTVWTGKDPNGPDAFRSYRLSLLSGDLVAIPEF